MSNQGRPLSPHLSVYRWPITMVLSILHRITGIGLAAGFVAFALWLVSAASGPDDYAALSALLHGLVGQVLLVGWTFAFFFHLANGVRHLIWDTGRGFEKRQASRSAWFVIISAVVLTAVYWLLLQGGGS